MPIQGTVLLTVNMILFFFVALFLFLFFFCLCAFPYCIKFVFMWHLGCNKNRELLFCYYIWAGLFQWLSTQSFSSQSYDSGESGLSRMSQITIQLQCIQFYCVLLKHMPKAVVFQCKCFLMNKNKLSFFHSPALISFM